jgi:hypothetical protein
MVLGGGKTVWFELKNQKTGKLCGFEIKNQKTGKLCGFEIKIKRDLKPKLKPKELGI